MYYYRLTIFPSFSLFWQTLLTDLFLVFISTTWPVAAPTGQLPCPFLLRLVKVPHFQTQRGILGSYCLLFQDMESSALLGSFNGEYY